MKSKEIFNVAVRLIGLLFLYQGLSAVPNALGSVCPVFPHFYFRNLLPALFMVGWPLVLAWWLVRGAPRLMRLAYPEESRRGGAEEIAPAAATLPERQTHF